MHAEILPKQLYHKWSEFAFAHPYSSIHQTPIWGQFQGSVPSRDRFWIIAVYDTTPTNKDAKIVAGTLLIKHQLPHKNYCWFYAPRGPLLSYDEPQKAKQQMTVLLKEIKKLAKQENAVFFRVDPLIERKETSTLKFPHFRVTHLGFQPNTTLILDLNQTEADVLAQMKPKGRYNIKVAQKHGIKIEEVDPANQKTFASQIKSYYSILQETLSRDKFYGHAEGFYKSVVEKLEGNDLKDGYSRMYLAYYSPDGGEQIPVAGLIATFYKDTAIYYYGASSNTHRNTMAPYLLQWHAISEAKAKGLSYYDFLGIAEPTPKYPTGDPSHPWHGVTEFKLKFGGKIINYQFPQEFTFKPLLHAAYKASKTLRKLVKKAKK